MRFHASTEMTLTSSTAIKIRQPYGWQLLVLFLTKELIGPHVIRVSSQAMRNGLPIHFTTVDATIQILKALRRMVRVLVIQRPIRRWGLATDAPLVESGCNEVYAVVKGILA